MRFFTCLVFPNPANDLVDIETDYRGESTVEIVNILGERLLYAKLYEKLNLDVSK